MDTHIFASVTTGDTLYIDFNISSGDHWQHVLHLGTCTLQWYMALFQWGHTSHYIMTTVDTLCKHKNCQMETRCQKWGKILDQTQHGHTEHNHMSVTTGDTYVPNPTSGDKCVTIGGNSYDKHIRHMGPLGTHMFLIPQVGTHKLQSGTLLVLIWVGQTHTTCGTTGDTYIPNHIRGAKCVIIGNTFVLTGQGKHIRYVGLLGTHMFIITQLGTIS